MAGEDFHGGGAGCKGALARSVAVEIEMTKLLVFK